METKQPSGAQNRKRKRQEDEQARREDATRRAANPAAVDAHLEAYAALGLPPTDPTQALIYAQQCMMVALHEIITDRQLVSKDRWKLIAQFGGQIGITHAKTLMQSRIKEVTEKIKGKKDITGGPKDLHGISKPSTARGGGGSRVDEQDARYLLSPPSGEDEGNPPLGGGTLG